MTTVPIVTEVTFAQLEALVAANGLNEGLQYKVTDKDWLLLATSNNLRLLDGSVIISNGDILPNWLNVNEYYVDSGEITTQLNVTPLTIIGKYGYYSEQLIVKNTSNSIMVDIYLKNPSGVSFFKSIAAIGAGKSAVILTDGTSSSSGLFFFNYTLEEYRLFCEFYGTYSGRILIKFKKAVFSGVI